MVVDCGTVVPPGRLPVYSCYTRERAKQLIARTCQLNLGGQYIAPELAAEQTIENLLAFGRRLAEAESIMPPEKKPTRRCARLRREGQ